MKPHFLFFAAILVLQVTVCEAQNQKLTFQRVPSPQGTSANGGLAGVQDRQGYMWFAHLGVHRYDGYKYKSYFNDPLDSNSLANDWVEALCADHNGFIWIGTRLSGLDRLDPVTGHFTHFRHNPKNNNSISSDTIRALLEDREGIIWIGTDSGLNRYDPKTGLFQCYSYNPNDPSSLSCNHVFKIYEDRQGTLWVGTGSIWNGEGGETNEGGLNRLDKKTGTFIRYLHEPNNPHSLIDNKVRAIFEDSRGIFWVGSGGDGLHTMNRTNGSFERHRYDPAHPEKLSRPEQKKSSLTVDVITFITEDVTGAIWIGTFNNGMNRYDPGTNKTIYYPGFKDPVSGAQTGTPSWACNSKDGMLWIGYWQGIFRINPLQKGIPIFNKGTSVNGILEDADGMLWYGTNNGLVRKDRNTGTEQRFVYDPRDPHSISDNYISSIYEDRHGILWIGTQEGLNSFDRKTGKFTRFVINSGKGNATVIALYEDSHGAFWVGTYRNNGLVLMDRQNGSFEYYLPNPEDSTSYGNNAVHCIYEDKSGNLWIGSFMDGLYRFMRQTGKFQRFLKGVSVFSLCQDSKGILWVGTAAGLYHSNSSGDGFSHFTDPNSGLPENMVINSLIEDNQKALWINTSEGIYRLNSSRSEIVNYSSRYEGEFTYTAFSCNKAKSGELFFGTPGGHYAFFPEKLITNSIPPQILITEFKLADKLVIPGKESPLKKSLSEIKEIQLRYNQNVFSFDFAGIHYGNPQQNRHLFMLESLDKTWRKAGEEKTAYYYNVPPGRYIFHVKVSNSDGVWAEKSIAIIVSPPWWRTWWAYILFALLLAGIIYGAVQYRINKIKMQHGIVLQQHKATELEMQALRAQMNPHFIFNCLSSINRFILKNESEIASDYLTKFSRLVRLILQNSQAAFISLESELESLQLYLELEALRFNLRFDYKITVADGLDMSAIKVPPLIIQPYAENAIWHGLMHKEEKGNLDIAIEQDNDHLIVSIADDGIGRKAAAELASKSAMKHKSVGLNITAERIAILQSPNSNESPVTINDFVNTDGTAAGTEVIIKIPVIY